jgi:hypothetical protein
VLGARPGGERAATPSAVAWLPDGAGFPNSLPTLFAHAGVAAFVTAGLAWNDGRAFPHARFWWEGPDGSRVLATESGARHGAGRLEHPPVVRDELRARRAVRKRAVRREFEARNAAFERALAAAEQAGAWALALHASPFFLAEFRRQLDAASELVLRAQSAAAYEAARADYDRAEELIAGAAGNARSVLPRAGAHAGAGLADPTWQGGAYVFSNAHLFARVRADGSIVDLRCAGGPNLVRRANRLRGARALESEVVDGALEVRFRAGSASLGVARIALGASQRFLRVEIACGGPTGQAALRCENDLGFDDLRARFGSPHGSVDRAPRNLRDVYGQRYARLDGRGRGLAVLALDTYGWRVRPRRGGTRFDHLLNVATGQGDAAAYAFVPFAALGMGTLERLWEDFAVPAEVAMFACERDSLAVVATKVADDCGGVVVRVRECAGLPAAGSIACAARAREVTCVDAFERPVAGEAALRDGAIEASFRPYELRSFLVRLG